LGKAKGAVENSLRTVRSSRIVADSFAGAAFNREQMLRKLPRERRQIYQRIRKLREEIGTVDFDVVLELRNLRNA
jgi:hypothetical protein